MEVEEEEEEGRQEGLFHSGENEENGNKQKKVFLFNRRYLLYQIFHLFGQMKIHQSDHSKKQE